MSIEPIRVLSSHVTVALSDGELQVSTSSFANTHRPVSLHMGPAEIYMSVDQAIELGDALIVAGHHYRALMADLAAREAERVGGP